MDKTELLFINETLQHLDKLVLLHKEISHLDESLSSLYPVAVVHDNSFYVFDNESSNYQLIQKQKTPMPVPKGVLASFPLDFYNNKAAAVIDSGAFTTLEGYIYIFHEFVHCYQYYNGEQEIRKNLNIAKEYAKEQNHMWEITHTFPYTDQEIILLLSKLDKCLNMQDISAVLKLRSIIKNKLNPLDYEYMVWQEWKEGYARFVENKLRKYFSISINTNNITEKLSRVSFYHLGYKYIALLLQEYVSKISNIKDLYQHMNS